jgi:hypothetical protein
VGALALGLSFCHAWVLVQALRPPLSTFKFWLPQKLLSMLQANSDTICCPEMCLIKGGFRRIAEV